MKPTDEVSPDEDLVNKWRLAQGDLLVAKNARGKISHAIPIKLTIIKDLIRREVFPYHYEIYGMGFLEMQSAFRSPLKAKCSSVLLEQWGIGMSSGSAAAMYLNVCRAVGAAKVTRVEFLLGMTERRKTIRKLIFRNDRRKEENLEDFSKSFERLIEVMDLEKEKMLEIGKNV